MLTINIFTCTQVHYLESIPLGKVLFFSTTSGVQAAKQDCWIVMQMRRAIVPIVIALGLDAMTKVSSKGVFGINFNGPLEVAATLKK